MKILVNDYAVRGESEVEIPEGSLLSFVYESHRFEVKPSDGHTLDIRVVRRSGQDQMHVLPLSSNQIKVA